MQTKKVTQRDQSVLHYLTRTRSI